MTNQFKCGIIRYRKGERNEKKFQKKIKKIFKNPLTNQSESGIINTERERKIPNTREVNIMTVKYIVIAQVVADMEGRTTKDFTFGEYVNTLEEAKSLAECVKNDNYYFTGDYRIEKRTIDEIAFTVEDEVVYNYNWYDEVGRKESAKKDVALFNALLEEAIKGLERCKTERGRQGKEKLIARYKEEIDRAEKVLNG